MLKKMILMFHLFDSIFSGNTPPLSLGGTRDVNNCLVSAGYTWCQSSLNCIRQWETPCEDNFIDCGDCLKKQRDGYNIACPENCDMIHQIDPVIDSPTDLPIPMPPVVIDPMPPVVIDPMPPPMPEPVTPTFSCPPVCMIYCQNGNQLDENGCPTCNCNEELPPPVTDQDCTLQQPSCDGYEYVCPKITEITNCNEGGIDGYTTFQLSLIVKPNKNILNLYAIYGDEHNEVVTYFPPSYQVYNGNNIGGISPYMVQINPNSLYDSWLTIGITNGDNNNQISTIGVDFSSWNENNGLTINNGAVFLMDPTNNPVNGNEYIIGQLTVRTNSNPVAIVNIQGKTIDTSIDKSWQENNIRFELNSPVEIVYDTIPTDCSVWYDGCNTCQVNNGNIGSCSRMMCFTENPTRCINYNSGH